MLNLYMYLSHVSYHLDFVPLAVKTEGPGPGAYKTVDSFLNNDKPAFSFRKRLKDLAEAESK